MSNLRWWIALFLLGGAVQGSWALVDKLLPIKAQAIEVSTPPVSWVAHQGDGFSVTVVDVGPVCLYVIPRYLDMGPAIWGVPKNQLPPGRGCQ